MMTFIRFLLILHIDSLFFLIPNLQILKQFHLSPVSLKQYCLENKQIRNRNNQPVRDEIYVGFASAEFIEDVGEDERFLRCNVTVYEREVRVKYLS